MRAARISTNTYQYECPRPQCGLKFAVGNLIVTGTMTPEHLKRRGGRRTGHCHCGHKFATEFHDKKNVMWRMPIGKMGMKGAEPATAVFPLRNLPRIPSNSSSQESTQMKEIREKMAKDPVFADSILATAERAARAMTTSTLESKREEGKNRLKPISKARRALQSRIEAMEQEILEECDEAMPTHYSPSEGSVTATGDTLVMEASS